MLHVISGFHEGFHAEIIKLQDGDDNVVVEVVDLSIGDVDYDKLLDSIFSVDSVYVW